MAAPEASSEPSAPGLYVHVPFCSAICTYCNFNRGLFDETLKQRFVAALLADIRSQAPCARRLPPPDTLYFGGGTPSLLTSDEVASIIECSRHMFGLSEDAEITLEANPESIDRDRLEAFRRVGVNRLSVGVQSFKDDELQRLGRLHSSAGARDAIRAARTAGFDNVSLDLMMGLPAQHSRDWIASVVSAIDLRPDHVSLYILEIYPHLPLRSEMERYRWVAPAEDDVVVMYESAMDLLERAGYCQYEISNVCVPGCASRHNLKYWTDGQWWAFGPGAHATIAGVRRRNISSTTDYIDRAMAGLSVVADERFLTVEERLGDALFTGLRLSAGIDVADVSKRYGIDAWALYESRLTPFFDAGLLSRQETRLRLTRSGMLLANEVMSVFV